MSILNKIIKKKDVTSLKSNQEKKGVAKKAGNKKTESKKNKSPKNKKITTDVKRKKEEMVSKIKKISKDKIPNHYFDLIRKPHISEKTFNLSNKNQYVFIVSDKINKSEIKKAVKSLYKVSVVSVNTINVPSKSKMFKGKPGVRSGYKKAIVKLAKGSTIDLMKEVK